MKKLTFLIIAILLSLTTSAQTMFSVPELTDSQKFSVAKNLCYNNIVLAISYAKSQGKTIEDYAKYGADQINAAGNFTMGFDQFVNYQLNDWAAMAGNVVILSQSENKVVIRISQVNPALETQGPFWNVSYAEMMKWLEALYARMSQPLGFSYSMNINDEGADITIGKK